jgi:hypothetical protein
MPGVEKLGLLGKLNSTIEILVQPTTTTIEEVVRPEGYAIQGLACFRVVVKSDDLTADGWGTGSSEVAAAKALSEALERFAMFTQVKSDPSVLSSNGWAAHPEFESARLRAFAEVVERDTALTTWFNAGPYYSVSESQWPDVLVKWKNSVLGSAVEFSHPLVLLAEGSFGACISVLLQTQDGRTVVGHASGVELQKSIESAFYEALRSAHAALRFDEFAETVDLHSEECPTVAYGPGANGMAYAYGAPMPKLDVESKSDAEIQSKWQHHREKLQALTFDSDFRTYKVGDRFVVRALVHGSQEVFWGRTPKHMKVKNNFPHFVG